MANDNTNRREVYDLSYSLDRLGIVDVGNYDNKFGEYNRLNIVLAKQGLLLVGQRDSDASRPHSVVFYNISSPSISDVVTIPDQPDSVESQVYSSFKRGIFSSTQMITLHATKLYTFAFRTRRGN